MYYKIISEGQVWYSKEAIKAFYHCGDDLQIKLIEGKLFAHVIMDRIVYMPTSASEARALDKAVKPEVQDLGAAIKDFILPKKENPDLSLVDRIEYDRKTPVYDYQGFKFIKFSAVFSKSKYRDQQHLPLLEVCGVKYVALGCIKRGETYYIG